MSTYRCRVLATAQGVPVHNVFHVAAGDAPPAPLVQDIADAWRAHIPGLLAGAYTFQGVEMENIATDDASVFSAGTTGRTTGAGTATALPTFVCASVRLQTSRRGRAGAGRMGLGPLEETATTGGEANYLAPAMVTLVKSTMEAFITDLQSSGGSSACTLAVVSYYKGTDLQGKPIKRAEPLISLVSSVAVNTVVGTRLSRHPNR